MKIEMLHFCWYSFWAAGHETRNPGILQSFWRTSLHPLQIWQVWALEQKADLRNLRMHPNVLKNDVDLKLEFKVERTETSLSSEPSSDSSSKAYILKVEKLAESTFHPPQKWRKKCVNCDDNFATNVSKSWSVNTLAKKVWYLWALYCLLRFLAMISIKLAALSFHSVNWMGSALSA